MFSIGGSFGGGENMINAGVSVKLGQGNHVSTSRVAMAKEIRDLRELVATQMAEMARMMQMGFGQSDPEMERLVDEFAPELQYIRVDTVHKDKNGEPTVQRVRVTELAKTKA